MEKNDLISRAAAIDALTDENIEKNFDSVHDGELHRIKRAAIRIIANMPTVDAVPVVRCKDCQYCYLMDKTPGFYCGLLEKEVYALRYKDFAWCRADGERRGDDGSAD